MGYASMSVRPHLLDVYEQYYLPLGDGLMPALHGFVLGLLPGLEDESEHTDRYCSVCVCYYIYVCMRERKSVCVCVCVCVRGGLMGERREGNAVSILCEEFPICVCACVYVSACLFVHLYVFCSLFSLRAFTMYTNMSLNNKQFYYNNFQDLSFIGCNMFSN